MSMTTLEYDTLTNAFAACKTILTDLQPRLSELRNCTIAAAASKPRSAKKKWTRFPPSAA